ncbi:hypothetical protein FB45DRAFT_807495, partial [Roridomyces roridus]
MVLLDTKAVVVRHLDSIRVRSVYCDSEPGPAQRRQDLLSTTIVKTLQMNTSSYGLRCSRCGTPIIATFNNQDLVVDPGTRYHSLLHSNLAPLDSDLDVPKSILGEIDSRCRHLDHAIFRLREQLAELEKERRAMARLRGRNKGILSLLRRMPTEILEEIFSWSVPSPADHRRAELSLNTSPWVLTHVSSRWRAVALGLSSLWSVIFLDYTDGLYRNYPLSMVETQLRRTHNSKIQLFFRGGSRFRCPAGPQREMFQLLSQHASRWEVLDVTLTDQLASLLPDLSHNLPSLTRLRISWQRPSNYGNRDSIDCFRTAPGLTDISVHNRHQFTPIAFPARQLTRYNLDASWETHWGILTMCPHLVEAGITIAFDGWALAEHRTVELDHLRSLFVSKAIVLDSLKCSALEEISFPVEVKDGPLVFHAVESLVQRSSCTLRKLSLRGCPYPFILTNFLEQHPSVDTLRIAVVDEGHRASTNDLISELTGDPRVAAGLSSMGFASVDKAVIDYAFLQQLLQCRWYVGLKTCTLLFGVDPSTFPDPKTFAQLQALRDTGLDVTLATGSKAQSHM